MKVGEPGEVIRPCASTVKDSTCNRRPVQSRDAWHCRLSQLSQLSHSFSSGLTCFGEVSEVYTPNGRSHFYIPQGKIVTRKSNKTKFTDFEKARPLRILVQFATSEDVSATCLREMWCCTASTFSMGWTSLRCLYYKI